MVVGYALLGFACGGFGVKGFMCGKLRDLANLLNLLWWDDNGFRLLLKLVFGATSWFDSFSLSDVSLVLIAAGFFA